MASTVSLSGTALHYQAGPSRLTHNASTILLVEHACRFEQPYGNTWFGNSTNASTHSHSLAPQTDVQGSLADRYAETLWIGELHTGLSHFLHCVDRLRQSHELEDILLGLCQLIRSNSAVARRHKTVGRKLASAAEESKGILATDWQDLSEYEKMLARRTVDKDSPKNHTNQTSDSDASAVQERWTSAMESRETQLQILITMCLLQIVSQEPRALDNARSRMMGAADLHSVADNVEIKPDKDVAQEPGGEQPRKRSRKLEKARRWRGPRPNSDLDDAFAWNQQVRRRLDTVASQEDAEAEEEVLEIEGGAVLTVEHLSKRLEALVDILCLRQVAAGVGGEIADLLSDLNGDTAGDEKEIAGGPRGKSMLFGSSVRKLLEDDDMDDAQWLCSKVVEPHFEASLPRQCSLFRSKCFVSLQARTPARPIKSARTGSMGSPPTRAIKRSTSIASGGSSATLPAGGLSDVLEKEQAGRRVKRNILAERSSMLGRGREVDMGRRLSRSVSATYGAGQESQAPSSVFSRSGTSVAFTQPNHGAEANTLQASKGIRTGSNAGRSLSQRPESVAGTRAKAISSTPSFAASSSTSTSKRLLVMSTPQKEPASKMVNLAHLSQMEKPRLVLPSLVMESPTHEGPQLIGQRSRIAERCASFGGRSNFALKRSPSPVIFSDADD